MPLNCIITIFNDKSCHIRQNNRKRYANSEARVYTLVKPGIKPIRRLYISQPQWCELCD